MTSTYQLWQNSIMSHFNNIRTNTRNTYCKVTVITFLLCILAFYGLGVAVTGNMIDALPHTIYGIIFGLFLSLTMYLSYLLANPGKRHLAIMEQQKKLHLPDDEAEQFAQQMLEVKSNGEIFQFRESKKILQWYYITKDYAMFWNELGFASIVRLKDVDRIELDSKDNITFVDVGPRSAHISSTTYPMYFYYNAPISENTKKKPDPDQCFEFMSRDNRSLVLNSMQRLSETCI